MKNFKEQFNMVQRGESSKYIIRGRVYFSQSYGSRTGTNTRGFNTELESIGSECRGAQHFTHY